MHQMFPDDIRPLLYVAVPVFGALLIFVAWVNTRGLPAYEDKTRKQPPPSA